LRERLSGELNVGWRSSSTKNAKQDSCSSNCRIDAKVAIASVALFSFLGIYWNVIDAK
jgi:hypothetical protein